MVTPEYRRLKKHVKAYCEVCDKHYIAFEKWAHIKTQKHQYLTLMADDLKRQIASLDQKKDEQSDEVIETVHFEL